MSRVPPAEDRHDVWVCEGRLCSSHGATALVAACVAAVDAAGVGDRVGVRRGGCFGLCELGPNVVVRRRRARDPLAVLDADRLSLRGGADEHVCVAVAVDEVAALVAAVAADGTPPSSMLRAAREPAHQPRSPIEERMRALRARRAASPPPPVPSTSPLTPPPRPQTTPAAQEEVTPGSGGGQGRR